MDLAKAFDTVNHNILLFKLKQYGVRGVANNLLSSYLSNRKQFVHGNGFSSSHLGIDISVPQGSVLGPILFLIYINDLYYCSDFKTTLYADDSVLTLSHKNVNRLQNNSNVELCKIHAWLNYNQLPLNIAKANYILFTKKIEKMTLHSGDSEFRQTDCVKCLGVHIDSNLSWNRHIQQIESKLSAASGALYQLHKYVPKKALLSIYYSLAYSHLQYAIVFWGSANNSLIKSLQVKQNHLVKILCNKFGRKTRLKPLYDELEILNINGIYKLEIAKFMAKVSSNTLSEDFSKNFSALTSVHTYSTRSALSKKFYVERSSYIKTNRSLKVSGVKVWNGLPSYIRDKAATSCCKIFSKILKKHFLLR